MSIFFTLLPFIFLIYFFALLSKTKYITMDLELGKKCYSCKEDINTDIISDFDVLLGKKKKFNLCESCKRDETINKLFNGNLSLINKFKFYLVSSNKSITYFIFLIIILLIVDIVFQLVFDIKWFTYIYNSFLVLYWILTIYRHKLISIKKPSQ